MDHIIPTLPASKTSKLANRGPQVPPIQPISADFIVLPPYFYFLKLVHEHFTNYKHICSVNHILQTNTIAYYHKLGSYFLQQVLELFITKQIYDII